MIPPDDDGWGQARRYLIAFCCGWWMASVALGSRHFVELWGRGVRTVPELFGVPIVAGTFLPGAQPFFAAAGTADVTGLPVGFSGVFVGIALAAAVYVTLPLALHVDDRARAGRVLSRAMYFSAMCPYAAGAVGISYLYESAPDRGRRRARAIGRVLVIAAAAYLVVAGFLFLFALAFLSG